MANHARTHDDIINVLHATVGEPMTQHLLTTHNLGDDIDDLVGGELKLREFGNALHETLQVAANSLPEEAPPTSKKAFILLNPRELRTMVDTIIERIAGRDVATLQR